MEKLRTGTVVRVQPTTKMVLTKKNGQTHVQYLVKLKIILESEPGETEQISLNSEEKFLYVDEKYQ